MNDKGNLTGWTSMLILASIVLAIVGGALAPDGKLYTWLLVGAWGVMLTAFNNVYRKVRTKVDEAQIRADERQRMGLTGRDGRPS
jgi:hypothetical protein